MSQSGAVVDWSCTYFFQFQNTLRGSFHRSERPIWSRCAISCRSEVDELFLGRNGRCEVDVLSLADLKSMNYFSVGTADVKSMSYLMPSLGRSEVDELFPGLNGRFEVDVLFLGQDGRSGYTTPGYTDQWYWSMHSHRPVLFHCCIFVLVYWAVWWRNCAYKYVYVVGW